MNVKTNALLFLCLFCLYSYAHGSPLFDRRLSWSKNFLKSTRDNPKPSTGTSWSKNFLKSTRDNPKPSTGTSWSKNFLASTKPASTNWLSNSKGSSFSSFKPFTPLSTTKNAWSYKPPSLTTTKNWLGNYKPYLSTFKGTPRTRNSYAYLPKTSYASFARNSAPAAAVRSPSNSFLRMYQKKQLGTSYAPIASSRPYVRRSRYSQGTSRTRNAQPFRPVRDAYGRLSRWTDKQYASLEKGHNDGPQYMPPTPGKGWQMVASEALSTGINHGVNWAVDKYVPKNNFQRTYPHYRKFTNKPFWWRKQGPGF